MKKGDKIALRVKASDSSYAVGTYTSFGGVFMESFDKVRRLSCLRQLSLIATSFFIMHDAILYLFKMHTISWCKCRALSEQS